MSESTPGRPTPGPPTPGPPMPGPPDDGSVQTTLDALKGVDPDDLEGVLAAGEHLHTVLQRRLGDLRGD